jgi:hypothetical protein
LTGATSRRNWSIPGPRPVCPINVRRDGERRVIEGGPFPG